MDNFEDTLSHYNHLLQHALACDCRSFFSNSLRILRQVKRYPVSYDKVVWSINRFEQTIPDISS